MAVWKTKNGCWYGRVICNGITHNLPKSYPTRKEAEYAVYMLKTSLKAKRTVDKIAIMEQMVDQEVEDASFVDHYANIDIKDGWKEYCKLGHTNIARLSERSVEIYSKFWKMFADYVLNFRNCHSLKEVNQQVVSDFASYLNGRTTNKNRINNIIVLLRKIWRAFGIVSTHRCFKSNPFDIISTKAVARKEYRRNFNDEEIKKVFEVLDNPKNAYDRRKFPHLKLFVTFCLRTGLRKVDVCNIEWEEITLDDNIEKRLIILKPKKTKGYDREVVIPIADDLYELLKTRRSECPEDEVYVDRQLKEWYDSRWIEGLHRNILKRANIEMDEVIDGARHTVLSAHSWRHTFISKCASADHPISEQVVRDMVAHSSINIHRKYQHIDVKSKVKAIKSITEGNVPRTSIKLTDYNHLLMVKWMFTKLPKDVKLLQLEIARLKEELDEYRRKEEKGA